MALNKREATRLAHQIRDGITNTAKALQAFIDGEGWTVLGHNSFTDWWKADMPDTPAATILPLVVYRMLDDGATTEQVAAAVKGVGRDTADFLARQRSNNVPGAVASTRKPKPKTGCYYSTLFVHVPTKTLTRWKAIAAGLDTTPEEIATGVLTQHFNELGRESA